jgi:hypothetical protein
VATPDTITFKQVRAKKKKRKAVFVRFSRSEVSWSWQLKRLGKRRAVASSLEERPSIKNQRLKRQRAKAAVNAWKLVELAGRLTSSGKFRPPDRRRRKGGLMLTPTAPTGLFSLQSAGSTLDKRPCELLMGRSALQKTGSGSSASWRDDGFRLKFGG